MGKNTQTKLPETSVKNQFLAAFVVNLLFIGNGISCGWSSPSISLLISEQSPLPSGKISMEEASWIASLLCIGGLSGNLFFGFVSNAFGRKLPILFISIPTIIGWILILFAQNVYYLYASRMLNGFVGGGIFVLVPLFLSEIANDRVRGVLGSTLVLTSNIGILIAFVFGNYCDFYTTPKFVIALTILFAVLFYFFPETPAFLMKQNNISESERSIRFYNNLHGKPDDYELIQIELKKLKSSVGGSDSDKVSGSPLSWSNLTTGPARKALTIGIVLAALNQFCGCFAMLNYTANIFKETGSTLSPNMSAIIVGIIQVLGSYMATVLVDRAGRKFLFAASTIGTATGLITLGAYMMLKSWHYPVESLSWLPVVSFSFVIFIASWAILTLPFLVISEVMPSHLKDFGVSLCMTLLSSFAFIVIKFLPLLIETLGFHGTMFLFAAVCLSSTLFILTYMPETKGKSYEQIMNSLQ